VWASSAAGPRQVVSLRSTDLGVTFTDPINISNSTGEAFAPVIAISDNDAVNVAWQDTRSGLGEVFYSRSTDGGVSFSSPQKVSAGPAAASSPEIVVDRLGGVSVAWIEPQATGGSRIMISRTVDGGQTFSTPSIVTSGRSADYSELAIWA